MHLCRLFLHFLRIIVSTILSYNEVLVHNLLIFLLFFLIYIISFLLLRICNNHYILNLDQNIYLVQLLHLSLIYLYQLQLLLLVIILLLLKQRIFHRYYLELLLRFRIDFRMMWKVFKIGISNSMQSSMTNFGKLLISSLISTFGTVYIAANSASNYLCNIGWVITNAFGTVLMTVAGQCIGAGEPEQAKRYTRKLIGASAIFTYTAFPLVILLRNYLVLPFNFSPEALEASAQFTAIGAILTMLAVYPLSFNPYSAFRASGDIMFPTVLATTSMFVFRVGLSYLLCYVFGMGLLGVWLGTFADWLCLTVCALLRFRSEKWLKKSLV